MMLIFKNECTATGDMNAMPYNLYLVLYSIFAANLTTSILAY